MKVLFFTNEYSHPDLPPCGGVGTLFKILSKELSKRGHKVYVYGFSKKKHHVFDEEIEIIFFKKYSKKYIISEFIRSLSSRLNLTKIEEKYLKKERIYLSKKLKKFAKKNNIDIIQSFTFNGFTAFWDNTIPLIVRFDGSRGFWEKHLNSKKDSLKIAMEKKALQTTPYTVANSFFSAKFIKEYYNVKVNTIIQNGIDTKIFSPDYSIELITKSIFYFGTISEAKGLKNLALIFNEVVNQSPDASLHLLGRGEKYMNYLKENVFSQKALKNIHYYGHTPLYEIPQKIMQASLVVVPTLGETFGFTIVEAMAMEKITIVNNIPVAKEIITDGEDGFIAKDNQHFVNLILEVLESPSKYKHIGINARKKVLNNFTVEKMLDKSIEYFQKVLKKH